MQSSMNTDVIITNDDPENWSADINKNVKDYLTMKGPPNIPCKSFPRNREELCFSAKTLFTVKVLL